MTDSVMKWYVVRAIGGQENKVQSYIETEISRLGLSDFVSQVLVPKEKVIQIRDGKKVNKEKVKQKTNSTNTVYEMQSQKQNKLEIEQDKKLFSQKINIAGLYDPEENDLTKSIFTNTLESACSSLFISCTAFHKVSLFAGSVSTLRQLPFEP